MKTMRVLACFVACCAIATLFVGRESARAELSQEYKEAGFGAMPVERATSEANPILDRLRRARVDARSAKTDTKQPAAVADTATGSEAAKPAVGAVAPAPTPSPASGERPAAAPTQSVAAIVEPGQDGSLWKRVKEVVGLQVDDGVTASLVASTAPASGPITSAEYLIGPGDVVGITVWRDESLSRSVAVLPDGKISFPLVGEMEAAGKTVAALKAELEKRLARYVTDVDLTVEVKQSNSMLFYVIGRVNAPGRHVMLANTSVLQALAMAGGPNPFARKGDIRIFRNEANVTAMFSFDYDAVVKGKNLESNIELKRGDVIVVP